MVGRIVAVVSLFALASLCRAAEKVSLVMTLDNPAGEWEQKGPGWSVKRTILRSGKQDGVDLLIVDNGKLVITVVPTRGMGILSVVAGDLRLGWDSPVKDVVHPKFINLQERGGLGWLEGFNEFIVRCGLEFNGHPGTDKFINNVGDEASMDLTLHGKIANIPATQVSVSMTGDAVVVRGRVDERMFYGPKLELWTELSVKPIVGPT
jgi:hypothetical protein